MHTWSIRLIDNTSRSSASINFRLPTSFFRIILSPIHSALGLIPLKARKICIIAQHPSFLANDLWHVFQLPKTMKPFYRSSSSLEGTIRRRVQSGNLGLKDALRLFNKLLRQ
jgi:hypothetical protein